MFRGKLGGSVFLPLGLSWSCSQVFTAQHGAENCFWAQISLAFLSLTAHCFPLILTVWLHFTSIQIHLPNPASLPFTATHPSVFSLSPCDCLVALRQISRDGSLAAAASLKPSTWLWVGMVWVSASLVKDFQQLWFLHFKSQLVLVSHHYTMTDLALLFAVIIPRKYLKLSIRRDFPSFCYARLSKHD